jgi:phage terminase large subunit GpA-like protein
MTATPVLLNNAQAVDELLDSLETVRKAGLRPPPRLTVSEWADEYRYLSSETAAEPGKWRTSRAPYQRGMMDACSDPEIERVVLMTAAQVGKTKILENVLGYYCHLNPAPILFMLPTLDLALTFSKDNLGPMFRDTPALSGKLSEVKSRDSGNTLLHKSVEGGGRLTIVGANSPSGLAMRPICVVLADEIDRFPASAGTEGDPLSLGEKRTRNFPNRKLIDTSTPTDEGFSRVDELYETSDKRLYHVPCPHCGELQPLYWTTAKEGTQERVRHLVWDRTDDGDHLPETAAYLCRECGCLIEERHKREMLECGDWVPTAVGLPGVAGFHLNALYSPWVSWADLVSEFLAARKNPEKLKVFVNTGLAQTWTEEGEQIDSTQLDSRRESYLAEVPAGVGVLTASIDVQKDRLELLVVGWGAGQESWRIRHERIYGDPEDAEVWSRADVFLTRPYETEYEGVDLRVRATCVDSGHQTLTVYTFVRPRQRRRVWATKGVGGQPGRPLLSKPGKANKHGIRLYTIGTDTGKDKLFKRLQITDPGPGYMHFCRQTDTGSDDEFLKQYGAEKAVAVYRKGRPVKEYRLIGGRRNEAIDLEVMALAALHTLGPAVADHLDRWIKRLRTRAVKAQQEKPKRERDAELITALEEPPRPDTDPLNNRYREVDKSGTKKRRRGKRRRGGWLNGNN